ncbi:MAG: hypothetical protein ACRC8S_22030 [Fimbriiglobus sp.]
MFLLLLLTTLQAEPSLKPKESADAAPDTVAAVLRESLDAGCHVLSSDEEQLRFWFRKSIPGKAAPEQVKNGLSYREIPEGTFLGIVEFKKPFTDYRKQSLPVGVYTLRLAYQPEIGDHAGTAPHTEFLLLLPVEDDKTLDTLEAKAMQKMSGKVTGADHPAVMLLFPHSAKMKEVKVISKTGGIELFTFTRPVLVNDETTTLGFAITVAGVSKSR